MPRKGWKGNGSAVTPEKEAKIIELHRAGVLTYKQIAVHADVDLPEGTLFTAVGRLIRKKVLKPRAPSYGVPWSRNCSERKA